MPDRPATHRWKVAASAALAVGLLGYFLARAPLDDVVAAIARLDAGWLAAAVAVALVSYVLRSYRWGLILSTVGPAPGRELFGCTAAGFASSTILPARAGELVRPLLLSARTGLPAAGTLYSIVTERLLDLATVLVLFAAGVWVSRDRIAPQALAGLERAALLAGVAVLALATLVVTLLLLRERVVARVCRLVPARFADRTRRFLDHLLDGLAALASVRRAAILAVWSLLVWLPACWQVELLARAFGLSFGLTPTFVMMAVMVTGLAVPTPGGVGGFHAATQFALAGLFAVDLPTATAFALVHHAICFFPITIVGLAYLAWTGVGIGAASRLDAAVAKPPGQG